jgi:hypothetical protein
VTTHVRIEINEGVAVLTLDGPSTLNAFSRPPLPHWEPRTPTAMPMTLSGSSY